MKALTKRQRAIVAEHARMLAEHAPPDGLHQRLGPGSDALTALLDALRAAEHAWQGLTFAIDQGALPFDVDPLDLPEVTQLFEAPAPPEMDRLIGELRAERGERQALLAAFLVLHAPDALHPALVQALEAQASERMLELVLALTLPPERQGLTLPIARARDERTATQREREALVTPATRWRDAWGLRSPVFRVSVRCTDVPKDHRKAFHLREQASHLDVVWGHRPVAGPELDEAFALRLRGARGEALHGFVPSRWEGELRATMREPGEVVGTFRRPSASPIRKPETRELRGTIEQLPELVRAIEALTERSFHVGEALVSASVGEALDDALAERARAWLLGR